MISEQMITDFFIQYAYSPYHVYFGVVLFATMSSFGLPIPEEIVLVSSGFIAYMSLNPQLYPAPHENSQGVDLYILAAVCFFAILLSDMLVYGLGRFFGPKIFKTSFFQKYVKDEHLTRINSWYGKYGAFVCGFFRFTPGLRFPGHMSCGMLGVKWWKFLLVDGLAALISVPTQVILVAWYGKIILEKFKEFKILLAIVVVCFILWKLANKYLLKKEQ